MPEERDMPVDVRSLLEQGCAFASMLDGLVIRIGACMGEVDDDVPEDANGLVELWEFTPHEIHRVECKYKEGKPVYHRLESRSINFEDVCQDLLDGQALEIRERKGTGPETVLAVHDIVAVRDRSKWSGTARPYLSSMKPMVRCFTHLMSPTLLLLESFMTDWLCEPVRFWGPKRARYRSCTGGRPAW